MKRFLAIIISVILLLSANSFICFAADVNVNETYKNLFNANEAGVEQDGGKAENFDSLAGFVDPNTTAYIAFAVYAIEDGEYSFAVDFSGADYACVKSGDTVKKITSSEEFGLDLVSGINIITCFGATAEQADAEITYKSITKDDALYDTEGSYYLSGDVNGDNKINIIDVVRFKKRLANVSELNELAAELTGDKNLTADDISVLRKYLLGEEDVKETFTLKYDLTSVNRDNDVSDTWEF